MTMPPGARIGEYRGGRYPPAPPWFTRYRVDPRTGCWLWLGPVNHGGYGTTHTPGGHGPSMAHRVFFEHFVGPIPTGMHLDHLCRTVLCVNPKHLEPVTQQENNRRERAARTHCPRGHEYTPDNIYWHRRKTGVLHRDCRACTLARRRVNA